jgi:Leucine-rich repeat (LRR) protein
MASTPTNAATTAATTSSKPLRMITAPMMISASNLRAPREGGVDKFLKKLTHLNLNDKKLDSMEGIQGCKALKNLYLYNNAVTTIQGIKGFKNLTHLYLENNRISAIENLPCASLQKLYINENDLEVIDNLQECANLTELHIASQRLPPATPLRFANSVLATISHTLTVLNIANNNISNVVDLLQLVNLVKLNCARNSIDNMDMALALMQLEMLQDLDLRGNPVTGVKKYMENLVANSPRDLDTLDGKEVVLNHKEMLKNLVAFKSRGMGGGGGGRRGDEMDGMMVGEGDMMFMQGGGYGEQYGGGYPSPGAGDNGDWAQEGGDGAIDYVGGEFR